MIGRAFALEPFPVSAPQRLPECRVDGMCLRSGAHLDMRFTLSGELSGLTIAEPAPRPERQSGLWNATCFEFFLTRAGMPGYWEFNLSPAGHWNVFRFSGYRQGMQEETAFSALPFTVSQGTKEMRIEISFDLGTLAPPVEAAACQGRELFSEADGNAPSSREGSQEASRQALQGSHEESDSWRLAVSTVLLPRDGGPTYWALTHPGPEADFHHEKGFLITL